MEGSRSWRLCCPSCCSLFVYVLTLLAYQEIVLLERSHEGSVAVGLGEILPSPSALWIQKTIVTYYCQTYNNFPPHSGISHNINHSANQK
ncbi:hypothetical protein A6R68_13548, partial [Neotoma lepida]